MSVAQRLRWLRRSLRRLSIPPRRFLRRGRSGPDPDPPPGLIDFGDLRRLEPLSREWGLDRGGPLDRYYIENFLSARRSDIRGRVLEIAEDVYTNWFGSDQVETSDILQYEEGEHPRARYTGDLQDAPHLPDDTFDCVIITQTLQLIYDLSAALETIHRILKRGGVLLVTVPGISQVNRQDEESWGEVWCWNFTKLSLERLLREQFPADRVEVEAFGNVLVASGFLYGMGRDDISRAELDERDPDYEMVITGWARKAGGSP